MSDAGWVGKTKKLYAKDYDRYRPKYPTELFTAIQQYVPISSNTRCLEIGIGTGQATESFLAADCKIVALEPAANLRGYAQKKYDSQTNLEVRSQRFEDVPPAERFDLVYAATSFHWVKDQDRMQRLQSHLNPHGSVALFWNHPAPDESIHDELRDVYRTVLHHDPQQSEKRWLESEAEVITVELRSGGFIDVRTHIFRRDRVLSSEEYLGLLHTYSDHLAQPDDLRLRLMTGIKGVIDAHGGYITVHDTIDLHLGRNHV